MSKGTFRAESLLTSSFQGVGNGHSHGKEEHGENYVRESHSVFQGGVMLQPVGDVENFPEFVHKYHQGHS